MKILLYRHQTDFQKKHHQCTIYCKVSSGGSSKDICSTGIETNYASFDNVTSQITDADPLATEKNLIILEKIVRPLNLIYLDMMIEQVIPTAEAIKQRYLSKFVKKYNLKSVFEIFSREYLQEPKKNSKPRSETTLKPINNAKNKLYKYLEKHDLNTIKLSDVDERFYKGFHNYMFRLGHKQAYIVKNQRVFMQVYDWAISKFNLADRLQKVKVEQEERNTPFFLNEDQFKAWSEFKFSSRLYQETADIFTIYCRTAFHYTDLKEVIKNPGFFIRPGLDGKSWIFKPRIKTDEVAKIPIDAFPIISQIVDKYGGWEYLPIKSNQKINDWLKICVAEINLTLPKELKIYPKLSIKHGRCTFCDWWINTLGNSVLSLLPIMGRTTDDHLEVYVRPDERAVIGALSRQALLAS